MMNNSYQEMLNDTLNGSVTKKAFLDWLYNKYGRFEVQVHVRDGICTKWVDWMEAREKPWYVENCNHRSIMLCECVFDLDLPKWMTETERLIYLGMTLRRLRELKITPSIIDTGKGYHLHYFDDDLTKVMGKVRRIMLETIMKNIRSDMMKATPRTMIAMECEKHWKRGNDMKLINNKILDAYVKIMDEMKSVQYKSI